MRAESVRTGPAGRRGRGRWGVEALERRCVLTAGLGGPAHPLAIAATMSPAADLDGNGIIVAPRVTITGQTRPRALVRLRQGPADRTVKVARADASGHFALIASVPEGRTPCRVVATDRSGGVGAVDMTVTRGDLVLDWNATMLQAIRDDQTAPPVAARAMAMVQVAIHDALAATDPREPGFLVQVEAKPGTSGEAAADQAAYRVLVSLFPAQAAEFEATLRETLATLHDGPSRARGLALGDAVGRAVVALRSDDGSARKVAYTPGSAPGDWIPTPPQFAASLLPQWPEVRPFVLASGSQFRPGPPPALDGAQYAVDVAEVQALGRKDGSARTAEQTAIANFWADNAGTFTPPGHWNQIAEEVALARHTDLRTDARLFAVLDMALADAGIVSWDAKYAYDRWRPETAIRQAGADGNPATAPDPAWAPLLASPPFPAYISGHSTFSGAAATVLAGFFGPDVAFTDAGDPTLNVAPRSFTSFAQAAAEAGQSRIYGGIHYPSDNQQGLLAGQAVGRYVLQKFGI